MKKLLEKLRAIGLAIITRPLLIIVTTVAIVAILVVTRPKLSPVDLPERVWPVSVVEIRSADHQPMLDLSGQIVAGRRSELRALVPGLIIEVGRNFREGSKVSKGELLIQIDPFEYNNDVAEQKALLAEATTDLEIKRRDLARVRELYNEKNISEQSYDDARLAVEQRLSLLEQRRIGLLRAERALQDARLTAPYDGLINGVSADLGKQLSVNDKVAEIIDMDRLEARFSLSKAQLGRILESGEVLEGRPVEISWQVGDEKLKYVAVVERIGAEIDSSTGGVGLYAIIESNADTLLRPGAFVWAQLADQTYKNVFRAPESALYGEANVYVVQDERLELRTIKVEGYADEDVLFTAAGDKPIVDGDQVVTNQIREGGAGIKVMVR